MGSLVLGWCLGGVLSLIGYAGGMSRCSDNDNEQNEALLFIYYARPYVGAG